MKNIIINPRYMVTIVNPPLEEFNAVFPTEKIATAFAKDTTGKYTRAKATIEEIFLDQDNNMYTKIGNLDGEEDDMDKKYRENYN